MNQPAGHIEKRAIVILSVGDRPWLPGVLENFRSYGKLINADVHVQTEMPTDDEFPLPKLPENKGRQNKRVYACKAFFAWKYLTVHGYDRILFVDDTCSVRHGTPDIFDLTPNGALGYVMTGKKHADMSFKDISRFISRRGLPEIEYDAQHYMNSGVLVYSSEHAEMITPERIYNAAPLLRSPFPHQTLTYFLLKSGGSRMHALDRKFNVVPASSLEKEVRRPLTDITPYIDDKVYIQHVTGMYYNRDILIPQVTKHHAAGWQAAR